MKLNKLGEFGLIERFRKAIKTDSDVIVGSGDDCAVLKFDRKHYQLFTCDMLVEGVDFLARHNFELIGRKAIAVSLSDIASCAGIPRHCVVSLGIPAKTTLAKIDALSRGIFKICRQFGVNVVGGDISRSAKLIVDVSMLGIVEKKKLALRSGAAGGDIIFVSGALGGSIRGKHFKFTPRVKEARELARKFKINSMIDISDGFTQDLGHILKASNKGAVIYENLIPLSRDARNMREALAMGEDFELLFTLPPNEAKRLLDSGIKYAHPVGEIISDPGRRVIIDKKGKESQLLSDGFRHF